MKIIIPNPINTPGTIPPRKSAPTEAFVNPAKIIIGILGGITTPIVEDAVSNFLPFINKNLVV